MRRTGTSWRPSGVRRGAAALAADEQHGARAIADGDEWNIVRAVQHGDEDAHPGGQPALGHGIGIGRHGGDARARRRPVTSTVRAEAGTAPKAHVRPETGSK